MTQHPSRVVEMPSPDPALVAAIRANPDDDTPRLACADWFEEQGDAASVARAEFIRTQIERARLEPGDPRQGELLTRELRLLKGHATVWCGSHFVFKKSRFRRGFIEYVHLHLNHFLHHRRQMFALEPVRDVSLTGWMRATDDLVRRVAACEELKHIHTLRAHHQGPHKSPGRNLALLLESPHLSGLRSLRLPMLTLDRDARGRLERTPALRGLEDRTLPHLDIFPTDPGPWFSDGSPPEPWANLQSLHLHDYRLRPEVLAALSGMPFWNRLTSLDVSLGWSQPPAIDALRDRLPDSLRTLRLAGASPWEGGPAIDSLVRRISELRLTEFRLHELPVTAGQLGQLLGESSRCELRELTLTQCHLEDAHARVLAASPQLREVRALDLSGNWQITPAGAAALLGSEHLASVSTLKLTSTPIGSEGVEALASNRWARLRVLELTGTPASEDALRRLFTSDAVQNLTALAYDAGYRYPTPVTPALASAIVALPRLASVRLDNAVHDAETRRILTTADSPAWVRIYGEDGDVGGTFDPGNQPPLDEYQTWSDQG